MSLLRGYLVTMTELAIGFKRTEHETSVGGVGRCHPRLLAPTHPRPLAPSPPHFLAS